MTTQPVTQPPKTDLILGTANIGLAYGTALKRALPSLEASQALFDAAAEAGFLGLDTAAAYGLSEQRIGAYRQTRPESPLALHTKLHPDLMHAAQLDHALHASEQALGGAPAQILLHRWDQRMADDGALWRALRHARAAQRIGAIGVSVQSPEETLNALLDPDIEVIQLACNLLDWRYETPELRAAFAASRARIEVRSVFLQGLLTLDPAMRWPELAQNYAPQALIAFLTARSKAWCAGDGVALAIRFALSLDWVDALVLGADTPAQIQALADVAAQGPLSAKALDDLRAQRPPVPAALLDPSQWL